MAGRPSSYTAELATEICNRMSEGESLRAICRDEGMPSRSMVFRWLDAQPAFRDQYTRAREDLLEHWAEEILEISDDGRRDYIGGQVTEGVTAVVVDHDHISRSRLRVDSRKWLLSKLAPKKYGDRTTTELTGPNGGPIETKQTVIDVKGCTVEQLRALAALPVNDD